MCGSVIPSKTLTISGKCGGNVRLTGKRQGCQHSPGVNIPASCNRKEAGLSSFTRSQHTSESLLVVQRSKTFYIAKKHSPSTWEWRRSRDIPLCIVFYNQ